MIKSLLFAFIASMLCACDNSDAPKSLELVGGEHAEAANDNPFLNGGLNPKYEGELTALLGVVVEIKPTKNTPVYKLDVGLEDVDYIWIATIGKIPEQGINVGDPFVFKGFISRTISTDPSGDLGKLINSEMLLMAVQNQRVALK